MRKIPPKFIWSDLIDLLEISHRQGDPSCEFTMET